MNNIFDVEKDNFTNTLKLLIQTLKIPVSSFTIHNDLTNHPGYPSLASISDCLTNWKIPNESFKLQKENLDISDLPCPFIAHIQEKEGRIMLVKEIVNGRVVYVNDNNRQAHLSTEDFLNKWSGVVIYAEKDQVSGEADYLNSLVSRFVNVSSIPLLLVLVVSLFILSQYKILTNVPVLAIFLLKAMGVILSSILLLTTVDKDNKFANQICSLASKSKCSTILESVYAQILPGLTLSELSWFYFAGSMLCLIFDSQSFGLLRLLNLISLPMTFYSVFSQIRLKEWCILCCLIVAILIGEGIIFSLNKNLFKIDLDPIRLLQTIILLLMPIALWFSVKPMLLSHFGVPNLNNQIKFFKNNKDIFEAYLKKGKSFNLNNSLPTLSFGSVTPRTVVTLISNPFCKPCADAHQQVEKWLLQRDDVKLQIIFATGDGKDERKIKVAKHLIALSQQREQELAFKALSDWYQNIFPNFEAFAKHYPVDYDNNQDRILDAHRLWCLNAKIDYTPTIIINNHILEHPYQIADAMYLLS